jgi:hypothetical protein
VEEVSGRAWRGPRAISTANCAEPTGAYDTRSGSSSRPTTLKVKNLVFAEQLADKAATLAAALVQK